MKPKPLRELWVNVYRCRDYCVHESKESADENRNIGGETVHFREVRESKPKPKKRKVKS
jgi:hypothetical protein